MAKKQIRCGIVGYGQMFKMGKMHGELMTQAGMTVASVCDLKADCRAQGEVDWGVPTYRKFDDMLKQEDLDLIAVITPHDSHCRLALKALNAGKHVVSEKVMCMSVAEADKMIAAAEENGVTLSVFQNRRWDGDFLTVRHLIDSRKLGKVFSIEATVDSWGMCPGWRREAKYGGGNLYDWGAHLIDQVIQIANCRPKVVFANTQNQVWDVDVTTHDSVAIEFENGLYASIGLSTVDMAPRRRWHICGTKGTLVKTKFDSETPFGLYQEVAGEIVRMRFPCMKNAHIPIYDNVLANIENGEDLIVSPYESRWGVAVIEAAKLSGQEKRAVEISEVASGPFKPAKAKPKKRASARKSAPKGRKKR